MNRATFTIFIISITAIIFIAMWMAWRSRARRDAGTLDSVAALTGEVLAHIAEINYVATTLASDPLVRVAVPRLRYRGQASLTFSTDGVTVEVRGEDPVHLPAERLVAADSAQVRAGKAYEAGGLVILRWIAADGRTVESSFRPIHPADRDTFFTSVEAITHTNFEPDSSTQEDAR